MIAEHRVFYPWQHPDEDPNGWGREPVCWYCGMTEAACSCSFGFDTADPDGF